MLNPEQVSWWSKTAQVREVYAAFQKIDGQGWDDTIMVWFKRADMLHFRNKSDLRRNS